MEFQRTGKKPTNRRRDREDGANPFVLSHRMKLGAAVAFGLGVGLAVLAAQPPREAPPPPPPLQVAGEEPVRAPISATMPNAAPAQPLRAEDLVPSTSIDPTGASLNAQQRAYVSEHEGQQVSYTLSVAAQSKAEQLLRDNEVPFGAVVLLDVRTGAVLALASHSQAQPDSPSYALTATQPAASTFKVVTGAALVDGKFASPSTRECVRGGRRGITLDLLQPDAKRDTLCHTLSEAMGASTNVVFARLADRYLNQRALQDWAEAFGFNAPIPFPLPVETSRAAIPADRLPRASAAAGFHHTWMSPLHGAMMAAAVAQGGTMMEPQLVASISRAGATVYRLEPRPWRRVMSPQTAQATATMMRATTGPTGTATKYLKNAGPNVKAAGVAGKTGSLSSDGPDGVRRHNSWFIGFAPASAPEVAVAVIISNDPKWRIKSTPVALSVLEAWLSDQAPEL